MSVTLDLAYFNYAHGGLIGATSSRGQAGIYDFSGLVRVMGDDGRWPDVLVMGEGDYYEFFGGKGMWGAAKAMRTASAGRAYVPLPCELPRAGGPFAPVIFYDAATVVVERFYAPRAPDFAARNRNVLIVEPARGGSQLHLCTTHGDLFDPILRCSDFREMRWLGNPTLLSAILADFNETLSGPHHEPTDLADPTVHNNPWQHLHRLHHIDGLPANPPRLATYALDYLCGHWDDTQGKRAGGIGFVDAAELEGITTGTNIPPAGRYQPTQIDHILLNSALAKRVVPGSFRIHEPISPAKPDSDHKRLSVTVEL